MFRTFHFITIVVLLVYNPLYVDSSDLTVRTTNSLENLVSQFIRIGSTICVIDWVQASDDPIAWWNISTPTFVFTWRSLVRLQRGVPKTASNYLFIIEHNFQLQEVIKFMKLNEPEINKLIIVIAHNTRNRRYSVKTTKDILLIDYRRQNTKFYLDKITKFLQSMKKLKIITTHSEPTLMVRYHKINIFLYNLFNFNMKLCSVIMLTIYLIVWFLYETIYNRMIMRRPQRISLSPIQIFLIIFAVHHSLPYRFHFKLKLFQQIMVVSILLYVIIIYSVYAQTIINQIFVENHFDQSDCCTQYLNFNYRYVDTKTITISCNRFYYIQNFNVSLTTFNRLIDHGILKHGIKLVKHFGRNDDTYSYSRGDLKTITLDELEILFQYFGCSICGTVMVLCGEILVDKWQRGKYKWRKWFAKFHCK